ncbi:restriction endonuclease subunit S [Allochromatium humboldtianum]|uniref:Restriction endonuclease subunit S n=1 Tax=Allochromatium humboldtianum TaxID=504901 RepID=A0A850RFV3_9GAMM|nr:restriction endonuclease subunit S [Allochromatium humboldtianum]NVZ07993.1 restriction endonuclease subunit S [Allochromatium humboldtianum]
MSEDSMSDEKTGLVPRLRFPEFQDAGEWELRKLDEISALINERAGHKKLTPMSITAGVGLVSQLEKFGKVIAGAQYRNYIVIQDQDFAYNKSATKNYPEGFIDMYSGATPVAVPNSVFTCFRVDRKSALPQFLYFQFLNNLHGKWLKNFITIGARAHGSLNIDNRDFLATPVPLPKGKSSLLEQQKIASCLSSLDALIAAQADKLDALKAYKFGLMQQLFPREGETVPRLRFPEFQEAGEWEEQSLEDMAKRGSGHTPNKKIANYYNGGIRWVSLADSDKLDNGYIFNTKVEISEDGIKNSSAVLHPAGTVILSRDAGVGKSAVLHSPMAVSQHFMAWQCHESKLSNWFFYYALQKMKPYFEAIAVGNTIKTIGASFFKEMTLVAPALREQQKIAACLSFFDILIAAQTEKLDALKTHKKGLMQQLFPKSQS